MHLFSYFDSIDKILNIPILQNEIILYNHVKSESKNTDMVQNCLFISECFFIPIKTRASCTRLSLNACLNDKHSEPKQPKEHSRRHHHYAISLWNIIMTYHCAISFATRNWYQFELSLSSSLILPVLKVSRDYIREVYSEWLNRDHDAICTQYRKRKIACNYFV